MKKLIFPLFRAALTSLARSTRIETYGYTAVFFLVGCTNTQVRWDATRMREDVMVYYNDQIMENLIKAKEHLPFVHVDIQLLTSAGSSQISGAIGGGETSTSTKTSRSMLGALSTLSRAVTRPFTYSVSPQQTETLSITAAPALGSQALASPTPSSLQSPTQTPSPTLMEVTKITEIWGAPPAQPPAPKAQGPLERTITEETPKNDKAKDRYHLRSV